ncbi:hypothetical protein FGRMN_5616 [Fusarium graminum]|nr:hypothetical protein FGRMN_5616 [Fusarium graminum]
MCHITETILKCLCGVTISTGEKTVKKCKPVIDKKDLPSSLRELAWLTMAKSLQSEENIEKREENRRPYKESGMK